MAVSDLEQGSDNRYRYLYSSCVNTIGVSRKEFPKEEAKEKTIFLNDESKELVPVNPGEGLGPRPVEPGRNPFPINSINEYKYILGLSNRSGNRTLQAKKKNIALNGVKFIAYCKGERWFMELVERENPEIYRLILTYSNPSILKTPIYDRIPAPGPKNSLDGFTPDPGSSRSK
jgi:hypothetical protein